MLRMRLKQVVPTEIMEKKRERGQTKKKKFKVTGGIQMPTSMQLAGTGKQSEDIIT